VSENDPRAVFAALLDDMSAQHQFHEFVLPEWIDAFRAEWLARFDAAMAVRDHTDKPSEDQEPAPGCVVETDNDAMKSLRASSRAPEKQ
jgi:hypothetical protein